MSNEIAKVIDLTEERFRSVAPRSMQYEAEKGFAMQILTNNPYLMKVALENPASLAQAITNVAAIGLSLNPAEKQAYLIPRNVKIDNKTWQSRIFLEPSYVGLCRLGTSSGAIEWVQANLVYGHDTFTDNGPGERPTHSYNAFSKDRGELVGAYCIAKTASGDYLTTLMTAEELDNIRDRSESWKRNKSGPWASDPGEMAKKAVIRRAYKMWPQTTGSDRMAEAVHISNENEGFEPIVNNPTIRDYTAEQKAYFDQLLTQNKAIELYVFIEGVGPDVYAALHNSFERPHIGKYKTLTTDLWTRGREHFHDYVNEINAAGEDDLRIKELLAELPDDAIALLEGRVSDLAQSIIRETE